MDQLTIKDLEFIIEAMEDINAPRILAAKFAQETMLAIKADRHSPDMIDYIKGKKYIAENAVKMTDALKDFEEETTIILGKLIQMRRDLQNGSNS